MLMLLAGVFLCIVFIVLDGYESQADCDDRLARKKRDEEADWKRLIEAQGE